MGNRPQVSCDYDREVADVLALRSLGLDVVLDGINRDIQIDHVHCIIALIHYVRNNRVHRIRIFNSFSVFSTHG